MADLTTAPVRPEDLREVARGIFYTSRAFVVGDAKIVEFLKTEARGNGIGRARVCAHPAADADQHDMLIASHRETYVVPHRHLKKSESFTVIDGECEVLLFDDLGRLTTHFAMGPAGTGQPFFYRMPARQFHSLEIKSEFLVFVESTKGPFRKQDMESADWAPPADDPHAGRAFIASSIHPYRDAARHEIEGDS